MPRIVLAVLLLAVPAGFAAVPNAASVAAALECDPFALAVPVGPEPELPAVPPEYAPGRFVPWDAWPPDNPTGVTPHVNLVDSPADVQEIEPGPHACSGIRPGARLSNGCTMNWVFTDGEDLYVGTAGHCASLGKRFGATGVGPFGTVVFRIFQGVGADFALIKVDADKRDLVNPTLCRFGGPVAGAVAPGMAGGVMRWYGWGWETKNAEDKRARSGVELAPENAVVAFQGRVSGGDSGSPIMTASGIATGVITHQLRLAPGAGVATAGVGGGLGTPLWRALMFAADAGFEVELVPGELLRAPSVPDAPQV